MSDGIDLDPHFNRIETVAKARGLQGFERTTSYGTPALRVSDRTFVRLLDATTLVMQCPLDQKVLLMEISPDIYFETDHYVGYDTVLIRLDAIEDEELGLRLEDAWRFRADENAKDNLKG